MTDEYAALVTELKALSQGTEPDPVITLPMAEDDWDTRPDTDSYGIVSLDFETGQMHGDDLIIATAYEGSVDLFSRARSGDGWIKLITAALTEHCGGSWELNSRTYERETGLFHWEWTFQVSDLEIPEPDQQPNQEGETPTQPEEPIEEPPTEGEDP